jgi:hypothetical protein
MTEKSAQPGEGRGLNAHPLSLYLPSRTKLQCASAKRADTLPIFLLYNNIGGSLRIIRIGPIGNNEPNQWEMRQVTGKVAKKRVPRVNLTDYSNRYYFSNMLSSERLESGYDNSLSDEHVES